MPLGAARITLLSKTSTAGGPTESYYFLYTPIENSFRFWTSVQVDSNGDQYVSPQGLAKYYKISKDGTVSWTKQVTNSGTVGNRSHTNIDSNGDLIVFGQDSEGYGQWIANLDNSNGNVNWLSGRRKYLASTEPKVSTINSNGDIYLLGLGGGQNYWLTWYRYNSSGSYTGYRTITRSGGGISASRMAASGTYVYTTYNDPDGYRVLYKLTGTNVTWAKQSTLTSFYSIACDSAGYIYVLGANGSNRYLLKVDSDGNDVWQRQLNTSTALTVLGDGLAIDSENNVYVVGHADSPSIGFIFKISSSGNLVWARNFDTGGSTVIIADITVKNDILYIVGSGYINSQENSYLLKLPIDGSLTGSYEGGNFVYSSGEHTISSSSSNSWSNFTNYSNNTSYAPDVPTFSPTYSTPTLNNPSVITF